MFLETENAIEETNVAQAVEETAQQQPQESLKEQNLRIMRERVEQAEKRAQELERAMQQYKQQPTHQSESESPNFDFSVDDDAYLEGKHLKKYNAAVTAQMKQMKQEMEQYKQQVALAAAEARLKGSLSDFDAVVSDDNLKTLKMMYPEDYACLMANPDLYTNGKAAYNMIKRYGITQDYAANEKKLAENKSKPRSSATAPSQVADTPLTRVGDYDRSILTEDRKKQILQQVAQAKMFR